MRRVALAGAIVAGISSFGLASSAEAKVLSFLAGDIFSGVFGNSSIAKGNFADTLAFTLSSPSSFDKFLLGSSATSSATKLGKPGDLDFTHVYISGLGGPYDFDIINNDPTDNWTDKASFLGTLDAGSYVLHIEGYSYGKSQYGGNTTAAAVPEPASWGMMVGGFGLIGGALRSRKRAVARYA
jgi:hypothetical protein